jgi:hypothetical protein
MRDGDGIPTAGDFCRARLFSVEEANRALVLVRRIVADIVREYARLTDLQETVDAAFGASGGPIAAREELAATAERLRVCLEELEDVGVELKDFPRGIVDFPARFGGTPVYLCWRPGEPTVCHWHELGEGFAQRRSIATLPAASAQATAAYRAAEAAGARRGTG